MVGVCTYCRQKKEHIINCCCCFFQTPSTLLATLTLCNLLTLSLLKKTTLGLLVLRKDFLQAFYTAGRGCRDLGVKSRKQEAEYAATLMGEASCYNRKRI